MKKTKKAIFLAGNFLSASTGVRGISEELELYFSQKGWEVYTASKHLNRFHRVFDLLWTAFNHRKQFQTAIIEVYSDKAFIWAEILSSFLRMLGKTYILALHGGKLPEFAKKNTNRFRRLIITASAVTTPSKYLMENFYSICPAIHHIPNGIDLASYPFSPTKKLQPNLIWLRAFHNIYSPKTAVETLKRVKVTYPDATLTMIGPDKGDGTFEEVNNIIHELGLEKAVKLTGPVSKNEVGKYLSEGFIYLNTTNYESFGVSTLEAAACGLCIVTTNVGELPYMWQHGVDAFLVPPNNPDAMAEAVIHILAGPELAQRLSTNARKKAEQFDWSKIIPQWESLIGGLI